MKLYGIPHCDSVKKALAWLSSHHIAGDFHDFKKHGVSVAWLQEVAAQTGWQAMLNKRGTTWRRLDDAAKSAVIDQPTAIKLMLAQPSLIKRPVLHANGRYHLGFSEQQYQTIFGELSMCTPALRACVALRLPAATGLPAEVIAAIEEAMNGK